MLVSFQFLKFSEWVANGDIFNFLLAKGILPVALYRPAGLYDNKLPYLYTNPAKEAEICAEDQIIFLAPVGVKINEEEELSPLASSGKSQAKAKTPQASTRIA